MIPLTLGPADQDKSIIAPIASTAAKATPSSPGTAATGGDIPIDDSSAEAVVMSFIALANAGQNQRLLEILIPQQAEIIRALTMALQPVEQPFMELDQAVRQAFPDTATAQPVGRFPGITQFMGISGQLQLDQNGVTAQDDSNAVATLEVVGGTNPTPLQVYARLIDGRWRIDLLQLGTLPTGFVDQLAAAAPNMGQSIRDLVARIQNNEFASVEIVGQELMRIMMQMASVTGGGTPPPSSPPETTGTPAAAAPPPAQPQPPAAARQREDVDNVFSGPGMLRAR